MHKTESQYLNELEAYELGVQQLLGNVPYDVHDSPQACDHEDDGEVYGRSATNITLRCSECGEFYLESK